MRRFVDTLCWVRRMGSIDDPVYLKLALVCHSLSLLYVEDVGDVYSYCIYRKVSNISRTKSQNLYVSHLGLQLSLHSQITKPKRFSSRLAVVFEAKR